MSRSAAESSGQQPLKGMDQQRHIHPRPRLSAAIEMLRGSDTVADIGCDHGRLSCALIQQHAARRCIAVDISGPSLEKARLLADYTGLADRVETRLGDGFSPIAPGEADAAALMGMGGTLMTRLLEACQTPLNGCARAVFQPMRGVEDIRAYLFFNGYPIVDDRVVEEAGRYYQIFLAQSPIGEGAQTLPEGWPEDCFILGHTAFLHRDPLTLVLAKRKLALTEKRLRQGSAEALEVQVRQLRQVIANW